MDLNEYSVIILLLAFALFGIGYSLFGKMQTRQFYQRLGFADLGPSLFELPSESFLLESVATAHSHRAEYKGQVITHCQAHPKNHRKFTLSRVRRKQNQQRWSITQLHSKSEKELPSFCLLPVAEAATMFVMLDNPGVDLSDNPQFVNRYHLRTDHEQEVKQLLFGELQTFLLAPELISVECIANTVIIKRGWPDAKIPDRLQKEFDSAILIVEQLESAGTAFHA